MFDDTSRMLAVSWVLFEGVSKTEAARRLACDRQTVSGWIKAYKSSGEWWPDPAIRNRHADHVLFDGHFLTSVKRVLESDPEALLGEMKDVFALLSTLPGYRPSFKCSIATLDRVLRALGYSYRKLYRMCRHRDQARREAFARVFVEIPLRCIVSVDETHKDGGDLRRRRGRWLRGQRYQCLAKASKVLLRTSTMMAVSYKDGVLHSVTTPTPPAQNSDDWLLFLNGLLPTMNRILPGLPWALQPSRCVLLVDNAPIHTATADAFVRSNGIFLLRLPAYSPELQPIEEFFSEFSFALKTAQNKYPHEPEAIWHMVALASLSSADTGSHFEHCLMEAVRNTPELCGPKGPLRDFFAPLPSVRQ